MFDCYAVMVTHGSTADSHSIRTMSLNFDFHSHRAQLVLTALGASALTASAFSAYQQYVRLQKRRSLHDDVIRSLASGDSDKRKGKQRDDDEDEDEIHIAGISQMRDVPLEYDEELVREQLARNYAFFGEEGMARVRKGSVVIVGCGGVGSWAAIMLARSYVSLCSKLRC